MSDYQGTYTTNLNLSKDSVDDSYDVERVNSNSDKIDKWAGEVNTSLNAFAYNCEANTNVATVVPSNISENIVITFANIVRDIKNMLNNDKNKINITSKGNYVITLKATFSNYSEGYRVLGIRKNGSTWLENVRLNAVNGNTSTFQVVGVDYLEVGDYIELLIGQYNSSNTSVNLTSAEFKIQKVGF